MTAVNSDAIVSGKEHKVSFTSGVFSVAAQVSEADVSKTHKNKTISMNRKEGTKICFF